MSLLPPYWQHWFPISYTLNFDEYLFSGRFCLFELEEPEALGRQSGPNLLVLKSRRRHIKSDTEEATIQSSVIYNKWSTEFGIALTSSPKLIHMIPFYLLIMCRWFCFVSWDSFKNIFYFPFLCDSSLFVDGCIDRDYRVQFCAMIFLCWFCNVKRVPIFNYMVLIKILPVKTATISWHIAKKSTQNVPISYVKPVPHTPKFRTCLYCIHNPNSPY